MHTKPKPISPLTFALLVMAVAAAGWALGGSPSQPLTVTTNGVSITLQSPRTGDVVSNTITLSADASSLAGPIARVEFYADGKLVGAVTNRFPAPHGLKVY